MKQRHSLQASFAAFSVLWLLLISCAGCSDIDLESRNFSCETDEQCESSYGCLAGQCTRSDAIWDGAMPTSSDGSMAPTDAQTIQDTGSGSMDMGAGGTGGTGGAGGSGGAGGAGGSGGAGGAGGAGGQVLPLVEDRCDGLDEDGDGQVDEDLSWTMQLGANVSMDWVCIPGGQLLAGDGETRREAELSPFWMTRHEVTVEQFFRCESRHCNVTPCQGSRCNHKASLRADRAEHPMNVLRWTDARDYALWIGAELPDDNQWEWAARGGRNTAYPWGDAEPSCLYSVGRSDGNDPDCPPEDRTEAVCSREAGRSPHGLCDLLGNVSEYIRPDDVEDGSCLTADPPMDNRCQISRGGHFREQVQNQCIEYAAPCRQRNASPGPNVGFRLVASDAQISSIKATEEALPIWCDGQPPPEAGPGSRQVDPISTCAGILSQRRAGGFDSPTGCYWLFSETADYTLARCEMEFAGGGWEVVPMRFDEQEAWNEGIIAANYDGCDNGLLCSQSYQLNDTPVIDMRAQFTPVLRSFARDNRQPGPFNEIFGARLSCGAGRIPLEPNAYDGTEVQIYHAQAGTAVFRNMRWWWPPVEHAEVNPDFTDRILYLSTASGINARRFTTIEFLNLFLAFQPFGTHFEAHQMLNDQDKKCVFGLPMGEIWLRLTP